MELNPDGLMAYKVTELRAELRKRGLPSTGLKQVLVDRLRDFLLQEQEQDAPADEDEEEVQPRPEEQAPTEIAPFLDVPTVIADASVAEEKVEDAPASAPQPPTSLPEVQKEESVPALEAEVQKEDTETLPATDDVPPAEDVLVTEEEEEDASEPEAMEVSHDEPQQPIEEKTAEEMPSEPVAATSPLPPAPEAAPDVEMEAPDVEMEHAPAPEPESVEPVSESAPEVVAEQTAPETAPETTPETALEVVPEHAPEPVATEPVSEPMPEPVATEPVSKPISEPVATEPIADPTLEPVPEPMSEGPVADSARVEISTAEPMEITPAETATEGTSVSQPAPGTLVSDDVPPETVSVEGMDVDPADSLKRKRRSDTPPPSHLASVEPSAEDDITPPSPKKQRAESPPRRGRDARFKGLFNDSALATDQELEDNDQDEAPVEPSIHPVTRALYIRNFVRPLQEPNLRNHILTLASRSDEEPASSLIESFYLDPIRSHALIVFDTPGSANRVRGGIHNKVFPPEKTRKPLWADFVPEEHVAEWVQREKARGMGARWEISYETVNGEVTAELVEGGMGNAGGRLAGRIGNVSAGAANAAARKRSIDISNAPSGPRRTSESAPGAYIPPPMQSGSTGPREKRPKVMNFDQLFLSTRAKPKLYYLPVDKEVARERLRKQGRDSRGRY
ncbi:hypothetical protein BZA05DRAFT_388349 [Tricharina praecox]|uniref:uncharacterized protein n=1 Tax=Tricharina praecox TaxID=43433 RepID=UPI00221F0981|nr:uncharacterized protein BZA05DRAFT_388349 [Tricharina praecox]KAI5856400.1 hypothetical protein BZA05DRAFT_388349 [Tricharina praecox]